MTLYIFIIILGLIADRISKIYAINNFIENPYFTKIINFIYVENRGAAFGILQNRRIFFVILTILVVIGIIIYFIKNYKKNPKLLNIALSLLVSGALGNFYDRIFHSYVVDFIEFSFINFPVFNIADVLITSGSVLMIIYIIFLEEKKEK
ncbi:MAG: signal peptidase II [Peptoniphilaceae bacterium]|nr:signal peptidase II [Peptoniphilaceae bacterium]MDY6019586.1 signal peptidase II [Anaerococcus sp.]